MNSKDGKRLFSAGGDRSINIWSLETGKVAKTLWGHGRAIYELAVSPDGKRLFSGDERGRIKVWEVGK